MTVGDRFIADTSKSTSNTKPAAITVQCSWRFNDPAFTSNPDQDELELVLELELELEELAEELLAEFAPELAAEDAPDCDGPE